MKHAQKVIWTEGMFLRPHHFQQAVNYLENYVFSWGMAQRGNYWGFSHLEIDQTALRQGNVVLNSAAGVMPDGTYFVFHGAKEAPAPLAVPEGKSGVKVVLAMPTFLPGREDVIFEESPESLARYIAEEAEVDDFNAVAVGSAVIQVGQMRMKLMLESDLTADWTAIGVMQVLERNADNSLRIDNSYIPPVLNAHAYDKLKSYISDLFGLLQQRSQQMGMRLAQTGRTGVSEISDFLMLELINRYLGQVCHAYHLVQIHPEQLFCEWLKLACDLATFSARRTVSAEELPIYDHDDLGNCFGKLMLQLTQGMSVVFQENAIQIPLVERSHGLTLASVTDTEMMKEFGFVIAVNSELPQEILQTHFPAQMKVAPVTRIRDIVQLQLPGIGLRLMPVAPRHIPYHAGYTYFELEKGGELWRSLEKNGNFALHLAGEFPGLNLEFWAVRDNRS